MGGKKNPRAESIKYYTDNKIFVEGIDQKWLQAPKKIQTDDVLRSKLIEEFDSFPNPSPKLVGVNIHKFGLTDEWKFGIQKNEDSEFVSVQLLPPTSKMSQYRQTVRWPTMNIEYVDNLPLSMTDDKRSFIKFSPIDYETSPKLNELGQKCLEMRRWPFQIGEDGCTPADHFFMGLKDRQEWLKENKYIPRTGMTAEEIKQQRIDDAQTETDHFALCKQTNDYVDCTQVFYRINKAADQIRLDPFKGSNRSQPAANEKFSRKYLEAMAHPNFTELSNSNEDFYFKGLPDLQGKTWFNPIMVFHPMDLSRPLSVCQLETLRGKKCVGYVIERVGGSGGMFPMNKGERPNNLTSFCAIVIMVIGNQGVHVSSNSALAQAYEEPQNVIEDLYSDTKDTVKHPLSNGSTPSPKRICTNK